jgi:hypothetical protein
MMRFMARKPRGPEVAGFGSHVLEVRVLESRRILQTKAQHPVQADVCQPDQRAGLKNGKRSHDRDNQQQNRHGRSVHEVVEGRAYLGVQHITQHEQIGCEQQQRKQPPMEVSRTVQNKR